MKYFHAFLHTLRSFSSPHPLRDWILLLSIAVLTLTGLFIVSIFSFISLRSGNVLYTTSDEYISVPKVPRAKLEDLVHALEARRGEYESGDISVPNFPDPS